MGEKKRAGYKSLHVSMKMKDGPSHVTKVTDSLVCKHNNKRVLL